MEKASPLVQQRLGVFASSRLLFAGLLLSSCNAREGSGSANVLAKGDQFEVTVPELDQVLRQAPHVAADQVVPARRALLQQVVDEKLFAEAAIRAGLDRDVRTMQTIEAARRSILARAYAEKVSASTPRPSAAEVAAARTRGLGSPVSALTIEELTAPASTPGIATLQQLFDRGGFDALGQKLSEAGLSTTRGTTRLAAADLPGVPADRLLALKPGAKVIYQTGDIAHFGRIISVEHAAVSEDVEKDELADRLFAERRSVLLNKEVARLRTERHVMVTDPSISRPLHQPR